MSDVAIHDILEQTESDPAFQALFELFDYGKSLGVNKDICSDHCCLIFVIVDAKTQLVLFLFFCGKCVDIKGLWLAATKLLLTLPGKGRTSGTEEIEGGQRDQDGEEIGFVEELADVVDPSNGSRFTPVVGLCVHPLSVDMSS